MENSLEYWMDVIIHSVSSVLENGEPLTIRKHPNIILEPVQFVVRILTWLFLATIWSIVVQIKMH